uniref:Uncharacterized protein n=1 Tax=Spongospora subterranea TaxID=70186 RepID=A0A0H5QKH1_9EUKA|eukprot:CRZ02508.1 hypothetical protein [Spongospora subterranea]
MSHVRSAIVTASQMIQRMNWEEFERAAVKYIVLTNRQSIQEIEAINDDFRDWEEEVRMFCGDPMTADLSVKEANAKKKTQIFKQIQDKRVDDAIDDQSSTNECETTTYSRCWNNKQGC